jgi:hypothetical protein
MRQENEVQLLSRPLTDVDQLSFADRLQTRLLGLGQALNQGRFQSIGQVPADSDVLQRVRIWLASHDQISIAATPHAR